MKKKSIRNRDEKITNPISMDGEQALVQIKKKVQTNKNRQNNKANKKVRKKRKKKREKNREKQRE